jgi:hypothetical protein
MVVVSSDTGQRKRSGVSSSIQLLEPKQAGAISAAKPLDESVWQAWLAKGRAQDKRRKAGGIKVLTWAGVVGLLAAAGFSSRLGAASPTDDLSKYRGFQFGTDLSTVARQAGVDPSQVKVIHSRPALIQELEWRPQSRVISSQTESAQSVVFSFYAGELFRIVVDYDRYETEGMTAADLVDAVSAAYGTATKPAAPAKVTPSYGDPEEILAQWQDPQYRFELLRYSYGPTFKLVGISKKLEAPAQVAALEAQRLDDQEAPQRDAARLASEEGAAKAKLEKAREANKPKFRL